MAVSNRDRIRKGLDELVTGLAPFVERELKAKLGGHWVEEITSRSRGLKREDDGIRWDTQALLKELRDTRPLSVVMAERVGALRAWAAERTVPAN